jgi:hypothetical protein
MYSGNNVVLLNGVPLAVSRRVRQSDPLPPILFNLVLQSLKTHEGGLWTIWFSQPRTVQVKVKSKVIPVQAVEALRVARG